jgi:hypothetical protein
MKELSLNQMEMVGAGGMNQRNCMLAGGVMVAGVALGFFSFGYGFALATGALLVAIAGDCF